MISDRYTILQQADAKLQDIDNQETEIMQPVAAQFDAIFLITGKWLTMKN
jgi:hypothetical protein